LTVKSNSAISAGMLSLEVFIACNSAQVVRQEIKIIYRALFDFIAVGRSVDYAITTIAHFFLLKYN